MPVAPPVLIGSQIDPSGVTIASFESTTIHTTSEFQGPLPPPGVLEAFAKVNETLPDRIVRMAEAAQAHHHQMDIKTLELQKDALMGQFAVERANQAIRRRGQNFGFVIALGGMALGGVIIGAGHPIQGTVLAGVPMVALVAVFITGRATPRRRDRASANDQAARSSPPNQE